MVWIAEVEHPQAGVEIGQEAQRLVLEELRVTRPDVLVVGTEASPSGAERIVRGAARRPWGRKEADHPRRRRIGDVDEPRVVDRLVATFLQHLRVQHYETSPWTGHGRMREASRPE